MVKAALDKLDQLAPTARPAVGQPGAVAMRATLAGSLLVTLARPSTWVLALAAFLIRGGLLVFLIPIVVIPTPAGVADVVGPLLISFVFGGASPAFVAVVATAVVLSLVWLHRRGAARGDRRGRAHPDRRHRRGRDDRDPAAGGVGDGRVAAPHPRRAPPRDAAVRRRARVGTATIVAATYRELTLPGDAATPIAWRVLRSVPLTVLLLLVTWLLGEIAGRARGTPDRARRAVRGRRAPAGGRGGHPPSGPGRVIFAGPVGRAPARGRPVGPGRVGGVARGPGGAVDRGPAGDGRLGRGVRGALDRRSGPRRRGLRLAARGLDRRRAALAGAVRSRRARAEWGLEPAPDVWHAIGPPGARGGCRGER